MAEAIRVRYRDPVLTDEFWSKVHLDPTTSCWVWDDRFSKTGTPMHGAKVAWRFAYERLIEPLPKGSVGRRVCDRSDCVNPAHRVVTPPAECPTCHQAMPAPKTRIEATKLANGVIQLLRITIDEAGEEVAAPGPDQLPRYRSEVRTVDREGLRAESALPVLPRRDGGRKLTRAEALEGLSIQRHPIPLGDPTGRWEAIGARGKLIEFASGITRTWDELTDEQKSAFSRKRGKRRLEPGTFGREIEAAMGDYD